MRNGYVPVIRQGNTSPAMRVKQTGGPWKMGRGSAISSSTAYNSHSESDSHSSGQSDVQVTGLDRSIRGISRSDDSSEKSFVVSRKKHFNFNFKFCILMCGPLSILSLEIQPASFTNQSVAGVEESKWY